ncbi:MAG: DUF5605 domain-containing protein, partial [Anaerolineaceae bacterium]|nr:DUF5605 domain-containing protein [Anaerolineaceae bacterium]
LQEMNIEVDLILFHEYDRWNFAHLPVEVYDRILRYLIARIGAFRNLWWSLANEYDLMRSLSMDDWDHFFQLIQAEDPYQHLRSIHNCRGFYDHAKPWVTHCSIQNSWLHQVPEWREKYQKPVVVDECCYEGNIFNGWGNITAKEMVNRFWMGFLEGGYVTHGETYLDPDDVLWWAKGGVLHGESPARIAFLREIIESAPDGLVQIVGRRNLEHFLLKKEPDYYLQYFPFSQPAFIPYHLPEGHTYQAEIIDPWEMTITPLEQTFSGSVQIPLPEGKSSQAIRLRRID